MKKILSFTLCALLFVNYLMAQMNLNEMANTDPFHRIAQIKGTENAFIDYLLEIPYYSDTLYAFLCPLMFCPRCELGMNDLHEMLLERNPDSHVIMIASHPNKVAAEKYVRNKYYVEDVIFDTNYSFQSFLAFASGNPRIVYAMKIDRKNGRLLSAVDASIISDEFVDAWVNHTEPLPFYGEVWEGKISYNDYNFKCTDEKIKNAEIISKILVPSTDDHFVSNITFPDIRNGFLSFCDELDNSIYLYQFTDDDKKLNFVNKFKPNDSESRRFVEIDKEHYDYMLAHDMVISMCLTSFVLNHDIISFSVSLPYLFYNEGHIGYMNKPCIIYQNIHNKKDRRLVPFSLYRADTTRYTSHEDYYYSTELDLMFAKSSKGYPYFDLSDDKNTNPFADEFYDATHLYAIFDDTVSEGFIGRLGSIHKELRIGFAFADPKISTLGKEIAITDGTSGIVYTYNYDNPEKVVSTIEVFPVVREDFNVDTSLYGTEEYAYQFQDSFHNNIVDIHIDSKYVHTLSTEDGYMFMKTFTKKGKLKKEILVNNIVDGNEITISGFCNIGNELYVMAFYYDGNENYLLLLK